MGKSALGIKKDMEKLRAELNMKFAKYNETNSVEEDEKILALSRELDNILLEYIKNK